MAAQSSSCNLHASSANGVCAEILYMPNLVEMRHPSCTILAYHYRKAPIYWPESSNNACRMQHSFQNCVCFATDVTMQITTKPLAGIPAAHSFDPAVKPELLPATAPAPSIVPSRPGAACCPTALLLVIVSKPCKTSMLQQYVL